MSKYIKREIRLRNTGYKNTCNCYKLAPFRYDYDKAILYVTQQEHERIKGTITDDIIKGEFGDILITNEELRELPLEPLTPDDPKYQIIYNANIAMTNANCWYKLLPNASFCLLSDQECNELLEGKYENVIHRLASCMEEVNADEYFVKTGMCSTKHSFPPRPVFSAEDALGHLLSSHSVRLSLESRRTTQGILVQPWKTDINPNAEFRIFVKQGAVTGVSQQLLYETHPMMNYWEAEGIIKAFQKLWDSLLIKMTEKVLYRDSSFDGYVTTDSEGNIEAHLIEINSGALGWGPTGSALFEWEEDPPPESNSAMEFRITI